MLDIQSLAPITVTYKTNKEYVLQKMNAVVLPDGKELIVGNVSTLSLSIYLLPLSSNLCIPNIDLVLVLFLFYSFPSDGWMDG